MFIRGIAGFCGLRCGRCGAHDGHRRRRGRHGRARPHQHRHRHQKRSNGRISHSPHRLASSFLFPIHLIQYLLVENCLSDRFLKNRVAVIVFLISPTVNQQN